jgi:hypothetical protein
VLVYRIRFGCVIKGVWKLNTGGIVSLAKSKMKMSYVEMSCDASVLNKTFWTWKMWQFRAFSDSTQIWTFSARGSGNLFLLPVLPQWTQTCPHIEGSVNLSHCHIEWRFSWAQWCILCVLSIRIWVMGCVTKLASLFAFSICHLQYSKRYYLSQAVLSAIAVVAVYTGYICAGMYAVLVGEGCIILPVHVY